MFSVKNCDLLPIFMVLREGIICSCTFNKKNKYNSITFSLLR